MGLCAAEGYVKKAGRIPVQIIGGIENSHLGWPSDYLGDNNRSPILWYIFYFYFLQDSLIRIPKTSPKEVQQPNLVGWTPLQ